MHIDKAKKRIAKQVKKGDKGYPHIKIAYFGAHAELASEVVISFIEQENGAVQEQRFVSSQDVHEDEVIQSALLKIIERAQANSVFEVAGVTLL